MSRHFNVQIHVQEVSLTEVRQTSGAATKPERQIKDLLQLAVTADDLEGAYLKATRLLQVEMEDAGPGNQSLKPTHGRPIRDYPQA